MTILPNISSRIKRLEFKTILLLIALLIGVSGCNNSKMEGTYVCDGVGHVILELKSSGTGYVTNTIFGVESTTEIKYKVDDDKVIVSDQTKNVVFKSQNGSLVGPSLMGVCKVSDSKSTAGRAENKDNPVLGEWVSEELGFSMIINADNTLCKKAIGGGEADCQSKWSLTNNTFTVKDSTRQEEQSCSLKFSGNDLITLEGCGETVVFKRL
jgi:hypothetical protein